jgi:hypothetical protein
MVESHQNKGLIDASMKWHLKKAGKYGCKLFWVAGKFFLMKHTVPLLLFHHCLIDLGAEACKDVTCIAYHTCSFALLLAKNLVFRLVAVGGKLYTVSASSAFAKRTEPERLQDLHKSSVVDQLKESFIFEETLVEGDWLLAQTKKDGASDQKSERELKWE